MVVRWLENSIDKELCIKLHDSTALPFFVSYNS